MSSDSEEKHAELVGKVEREMRQFHGLGASFFRAAASRVGLTVTDMEVIDILESNGLMTAGQLADITGLTTGAITGMINRLEEAGFVQRERDPNDARRVIVRLVPGNDKMHEISAIFDSLGEGWDEIASHYGDEQMAFLLEFLKRSNAISREEIFRLREGSGSEKGIYSSPLGKLESGRLVVSSGLSRLTVRAGESMAELYQARFEGPVPDVKAKDGVVSIRYPRRLWTLGSEQRTAEVMLSTAIRWEIEIQGGVGDITAKLGGLELAGLEVKGGMSMIRLELPTPTRMVPIRIRGSASMINVRRPSGVAARVHLKGWASTFIFDDQRFSDVGNDVRLQSPGYDVSDPGYDIEVSSSVSTVTITSG